jgi:tellurite resistance protein TehA-like permease
MTTPHAIGQLIGAAAILLIAVVRWFRWRNAKAQGLTPAQFARANGQSVEKLQARARHLRLLGWGLIAVPLVLAALSWPQHRESVGMRVTETIVLLAIFGGLGLVSFWVARMNEGLARQM